MASKCDYKVRKCEDNLFRVFTTSECIEGGLVSLDRCNGEKGYETRSEAWSSLDGSMYRAGGIM